MCATAASVTPGATISACSLRMARTLQKFLDLCLTQPGCLGRGGRRLPQLHNPFFRKIGIELEHLGVIALELFTQTVDMPDLIGPEVVGHA